MASPITLTHTRSHPNYCTQSYVTWLCLEAPTEASVRVRVTLCIFAERLVVDVYVGSHLMIENLRDVYVFHPNGPLRVTLCHQTCYSLSGTPVLQTQDLTASAEPTPLRSSIPDASKHPEFISTYSTKGSS